MIAVVAAAVAISDVAWCTPFGKCAVDGDGVGIFHDEVRAARVLVEVVVLAVERY